MPNFIRLTGKRFGRLTVGNYYYTEPTTWQCICDCGTVRYVQTRDLRSGKTLSCGCLNRENVIARSTTHGHAGRKAFSPTYISWAGMLYRATKPSCKRYADYGGRGCGLDDPRWYVFENFLADMGERLPGTSLDRVDNNKGYSKGNCRWATASEQMYNRRR